YRHTEERENSALEDQEVKIIAAQERSNYPFGLNVDNLGTGKGFSLNLQIDEKINPKRILTYIQNVLEKLVNNIENDALKVADLSILTEEEKDTVLNIFNRVDTEIPFRKTIVDVFTNQVEKTPDTVAISFENQELTYKQLHLESNRFASYLITNDKIEIGDFVGLKISRSNQWIICMLGILKAGAVYIPIDPNYPEERIGFIETDSNCKCIIDQEFLTTYDEVKDTCSTTAQNVAFDASSLAYIIYTSGSTGTPKGVMIAHSGIINTVFAQMPTYPVQEGTKCLQFTNQCFDVSMWEVLSSILCGGSLYIIEESKKYDVDYFINYLNTNEITIAALPAAFTRVLEIQKIKTLQTLVTGGEEAPIAQAQLFQSQGGRYINAYGPTEASVCATTFDGKITDTISIGKPIANVPVYILNENLQLVPVGVEGELCIGGVQVAQGYVNNTALTKEKFIDNPFKQNSRLYKTGDLARWLPDGNIEFIGRKDNQVKIRGYRVELGEIENTLLQHKNISNCCVLAKKDATGNNQLIAYIVFEGNFAKEVIETFLTKHLPTYMIPKIWISLHEMPLNSNGKVDRKNLPNPETNTLITTTYIAPNTKTETQLTEIWQEILGIEKIGIHDNFFELGGHSLLIVKLLAALQKNNMQVTVKDVFTNPTIRELALQLTEQEVTYVVPENKIPENCTYITPEMVPLIDFEQQHLDIIMDTVVGGVINIQDIYPLSPLQQGIYFHHLMSSKESCDIYITPSLVSFKSLQKRNEFIEALSYVVMRHDVLRTCILSEGLPYAVQVVLRETRLQVTTIELNGDCSAAEELQTMIESNHHYMDVSKAPLLHLQTVDDNANDKYYLLLNLHHLMTDHVGLEIITEEVVTYLAGKQASLKTPSLYRNFIGHIIHEQSINNSEQYFRTRFEQIEEPTLPFGLQNIHKSDLEIREATKQLPAVLSAKINEVAHILQMSPATIFHAAFGWVIGVCSTRYEQVVYGTVLSGRLQGAIGSDRSLGLFINTLPIVCDLHCTVSDYLYQVHKELTGLLDHEQTSLSDVQNWSGVDKQFPLFNTILNYRHSQVRDDLEIHDLGLELIKTQERSNYPFSMDVDNLGVEKGFKLSIQVDKKVDPNRVLVYVENALQQIIENVENKSAYITHLSIVSADEKDTLLHTFNNKELVLPNNTTILDVFASQAQKSANNIAVIYEDASITYKELDEQSNQLAQYIHKKNLSGNLRIGIALSRGIDMIVSVLAVLKTGNAYVPIDITHPPDRISYMLTDSGVNLLITHNIEDTFLPIKDTIAKICLDTEKEHIRLESTARLEVTICPEAIAYIIYTSGTTGRPKGVILAHLGLLNTCLNWQKELEFNTKSSFLQTASFGFDAFIADMCRSLLFGGCLIISPENIRFDVPQLYDLIVKHQINTMDMSPSLGIALLDYIYDTNSAYSWITHVMVGADICYAHDFIRLHNRFGDTIRLTNTYGVTEVTIENSYYEVDVIESLNTLISVPIGKPYGNTSFYILDTFQNITPIGIVGELYIGGIGLAKGYINNEELTAEKFINNPFKEGELLYKTGDLARWLPDGNVVFIGRGDDQVKVRGYRIELGEIESLLLDYEHVSNACVLTKKDITKNNQLIGYIVFDGNFNKEKLEAYLEEHLPSYMVPRVWVTLDKIPLTHNGKVNRRNLPEPDMSALSSSTYVAPRNKIETELVAIWQKIMGIEKIGIHDNFFEIGGHSLLVVKLIAELQLNNLKLTVKDVFENPTIREQSLKVTNNTNAYKVPANGIQKGCSYITPNMVPLVQLEQRHLDIIMNTIVGGATNIQDMYPLSPLQEGMYFHHLMGAQERKDAYIAPSLFSFPSIAKRAAFLEALSFVIARHDVLRTCILSDNLPSAVQVVLREVKLPVTEITIKEEAHIEEELRAIVANDAHWIDVSKAPLLQVQTAEDRNQSAYYLLLNQHHLIVDNFGLNIIAEEIFMYVSGLGTTLETPSLYRNFIGHVLHQQSINNSKEYFEQRFKNIETPTLPFELENVYGDGTSIVTATKVLATATSYKIHEVAKQLQINPATIFHAAFGLVIGVCSNRYKNIVFGTVLSGRLQGAVGSDRSLGLFLNTLPIRCNLHNSISTYLKSVHQELIGLLPYEQTPLSDIQAWSGVDMQLPLFSAILNYRGSQRQHSSLDVASNIDIVQIMTNERSNYPFNMDVDDLGAEKGFGITLLVDKKLDASRIVTFVENAIEQLLNHVENNEVNVTDISILSTFEKEQILHAFNTKKLSLPKDTTILDLFEKQAIQNANKTVVIHGDTSINYKQLHEQSNQLANYITKKNPSGNLHIGIGLSRGIDMIICMLGVLKSGNVYVPIDLSNPSDRISYILNDAGIHLLITNSKDVALLDSVADIPHIHLDTEIEYIHTEAQTPVAIDISGKNLAYVIYTSGTTGQPKGVAVDHTALLNVCLSWQEEFGFNENSSFLQTAGIGFDVSIADFCRSLLFGGRLIICPEDIRFDVQQLYKLIAAHQISVIDMPPSLAVALLDYVYDAALDTSWITHVIVGSDVCYAYDFKRLYSRFGNDIRFINSYGVTEATIDSSYYEINSIDQLDSLKIVPIGKPLANMSFYILDAFQKVTPIGVIGELYIGGIGLAQKYVNNEALTAEKFIESPFKKGERLYKTGDLAHYLPDGNVAFIGRKDNQVKVRGYRIELGGIESILLNYNGITNSCVLAKKDTIGNNQLIGYVVSQGNFEKEKVEAFLAESLPEYMIPRIWVQLNEIPLTYNGKVDRKNLPNPDASIQFTATYVAPTNNVETQLTIIWQELLNVEKVGIHDNFFNLGGHSLLVTRLVSLIREKLKIELMIKDIFEFTTVKELASYIQYKELNMQVKEDNEYNITTEI
ncbi:non-ribosomal peptide synthetase, partial [Kordia zhangzhouensis]|uniref:non-ribosomal peptide synthetase n=1 Tax=Kordia zhangzhouensis TaxID=1620405 RepID=UPI000629168A